jgi:hypothetical protein
VLAREVVHLNDSVVAVEEGVLTVARERSAHSCHDCTPCALQELVVVDVHDLICRIRIIVRDIIERYHDALRRIRHTYGKSTVDPHWGDACLTVLTNIGG